MHKALLCTILLYAIANSAFAAYKLSPVPLRDVEITDEFWTPRLEKNRTVSLPHLLERMEQRRGFVDGRLIEAAAYVLSKHPDQALQQRVENLFDRTVESIRARKGIWPNRGDGPFFAAGHSFEGAVAYYEATGNRKLLDAAVEIADDIDGVFGPNKRYDISNHEEIKIGLVKLYRATGQ